MPSLRQWQRQYLRWLRICSSVVKEIRRCILIGKQIREIYKRFDPVWFCRDRTSFDIWENVYNSNFPHQKTNCAQTVSDVVRFSI